MRLNKTIVLPMPVVVLIIANIFILIISVIAQKFMPPEIPLFYGRPSGIEQLGNRNMFSVPPVISLFITLLNVIFIKFISDTFIQKVLLGISFTVTLLTTITIIKIILLVGSIN